MPGNRKETWDRAIRKVRNFQAEWKTTGPVPADKDRDLRTRFRQAADLFFRSLSPFAGPREAAPADEDDHTNEEEEA